MAGISTAFSALTRLFFDCFEASAEAYVHARPTRIARSLRLPYAGFGRFGAGSTKPEASALIRFTSCDSSQFGVRAQYSTIGNASSPQKS